MSDQEFHTPEAAEAAFYKAFSERDLNLMATVWSDNNSTLCIHPGSALIQGKTAVMQSWMDIFSHSDPPLIEYRNIEGYGTDGLSVRLVEERIRPRDTPPDASNLVLATNVFCREASSWRLVEHHASLPLLDRTKPAADSTRLH